MLQKWWQEGKFGLFIHWGLFSILGGEYQEKKTHNIAEWIMHDLRIPRNEYRKLASKFTAPQFNADYICSLAKQAGMKYVVFTSKHHEGFSMFDSKVSDYNSVQAAPFHRDPLMELRKACDKHQLELGVYYSQAQDWDDPDACEDGVAPKGKDFEKYFRSKCIPQVKEILTQYAPVRLLWFDTPMYMTPNQSKELVDVVQSIQKDCIISGRIGNALGDYMTTGDNFIPLLPYDFPFEVPATTNHSWGFNKFDEDWRTPESIIRDLVKIASRGGNYLLNIGPDADGKVPEPCVEILSSIGKFMKDNGESIYGTSKTPLYPYDIDWGYFTSKKDKLFIHEFDQNKTSVYLLNIRNKPKKAYLLKNGLELSVTERITCEGDSSWLMHLPEESFGEIDRVICVEICPDEVEFEPLRR